MSTTELLELMIEKIYRKEISLHQLMSLVDLHPDCIGSKAFSKDDITSVCEDNDIEITEEELECIAEDIRQSQRLSDCTEQDWDFIEYAIRANKED